ncbi:hypothetical protein [Oceaniradius stylonematis]|jgi:hypothetical protein|uniref:hypothetical protein n=1 Tax=Oceaniradius stylonematis TaxID=2184161 RepID=UPI0035CEE7E4
MSDRRKEKRLLSVAAKRALHAYQGHLRADSGNSFRFDWSDRDRFEAFVTQRGVGEFEISASVEIARQTIELWDLALATKTLIDGSGNRLAIASPDGFPPIEELAVRSLTWMCLHEMMHAHLGHLDLIGRAHLAEFEKAGDREKTKVGRPRWMEGLDTDQRALVRPCLELQADNDASALLLGDLTEEGCVAFRVDAACIFVMMALMDRTEKQHPSEQRFYPLVATRFFTLFSQLFQYWLYEDAELVERDGESFVVSARSQDTEGFMRFAKEVLALSLNDLITIALFADAREFIDDMGQGKPFFADLYAIQYAENLNDAVLETRAAQEWRRLYGANEAIMRLSGLREDRPTLSADRSGPR